MSLESLQRHDLFLTRCAGYYIAFAFITSIVVLLSVFHTQIALILQPFAVKLRRCETHYFLAKHVLNFILF